MLATSKHNSKICATSFEQAARTRHARPSQKSLQVLCTGDIKHRLRFFFYAKLGEIPCLQEYRINKSDYERVTIQKLFCYMYIKMYEQVYQGFVLLSIFIKNSYIMQVERNIVNITFI